MAEYPIVIVAHIAATSKENRDKVRARSFTSDLLVWTRGAHVKPLADPG